jgi:hypothetical protein
MGHEDSRTTADIYEQDLDDSRHAAELSRACSATTSPRPTKSSPSAGLPARDAKKPAEAGLEALLEE